MVLDHTTGIRSCLLTFILTLDQKSGTDHDLRSIDYIHSNRGDPDAALRPPDSFKRANAYHPARQQPARLLLFRMTIVIFYLAWLQEYATKPVVRYTPMC